VHSNQTQGLSDEILRISGLIGQLLDLAALRVPERLMRAVSETDFTLVVTPEKERSVGAVIAFLIPTEVILEQIRAAHRAGRKDWSLFLDEEMWARYRLGGSASASLSRAPKPSGDLNGEGAQPPTSRSLGEVIAGARRNIATVAQVAESAVKIQIDLG
jgi:hypothetical protein